MIGDAGHGFYAYSRTLTIQYYLVSQVFVVCEKSDSICSEYEVVHVRF